MLGKILFSTVSGLGTRRAPMLGLRASRRRLLGIGLVAVASTTTTSALALTIGRTPPFPSTTNDINDNIVLVNAGSASLPSPVRVVGVNDSGQLRSAMSAAQPGDHIVLRSGDYRGDFTLSRSGSTDRPVVVRSESSLAARLTSGTFKLRGDHQILYALDFVTAKCEIDNRAQSPRIWRCRFRDHPRSTSMGVRVNASSNADIAYCEWNNWGGRGVSVGVNSGATRTTIRRCLFRNTPSGFRSGAAEAIQFGFSSLDARRRSDGLVEHCRFVNWNSDDECLSIKTSYCTIRQCALENCNSNVNNRLGQYNKFEAIWIKDGRGISISDGNNQVLGCRIESGRLNNVFHQMVATAGNLRAGNYPSNVPESATHNAAENCIFAGNQSSSDLLVGRNRSEFNVPARSTRVRQHSGRIVFGYHTSSDSQPNQRESGLSWASLIWLNDSDVGPNANGGIASSATSTSSQASSSSGNTDTPSQPQDQPASSANNSTLDNCSEDPNTILSRHRGEESYAVARQYRSLADQHYKISLTHPNGSAAHKEARAAYKACDQVYALANNLARSGQRTIP